MQALETFTCLLCCNESDTYGLTPCPHTASICGTCLLRMRLFVAPKKDKKNPDKVIPFQWCCPFCQVQWSKVVISSAPTPWDKLNMRALIYDPEIGIHFTSDQLKAQFIKKRRLHCKLCAANGHTPKDKLNTIDQLKHHLSRHHHVFFCPACLETEKVFIEERQLYTQTELIDHYKYGYKGNGQEPSADPHPFCEFCEIPLFSVDELYLHLISLHRFCQICHNRGSHQYMRNDMALKRHFMMSHFLCPDPACAPGKHPNLDKELYFGFTVFESPAELKQHELKIHLDVQQLSRGQIKQASKLDLADFAFQSGAAADDSKPRLYGSKSKGKHRADMDECTFNPAEYIAAAVGDQREKAQARRNNRRDGGGAAAGNDSVPTTAVGSTPFDAAPTNFTDPEAFPLPDGMSASIAAHARAANSGLSAPVGGVRKSKSASNLSSPPLGTAAPVPTTPVLGWGGVKPNMEDFPALAVASPAAPSAFASRAPTSAADYPALPVAPSKRLGKQKGKVSMAAIASGQRSNTFVPAPAPASAPAPAAPIPAKSVSVLAPLPPPQQQSPLPLPLPAGIPQQDMQARSKAFVAELKKQITAALRNTMAGSMMSPDEEAAKVAEKMAEFRKLNSDFQHENITPDEYFDLFRRAVTCASSAVAPKSPTATTAAATYAKFLPPEAELLFIELVALLPPQFAELRTKLHAAYAKNKILTFSSSLASSSSSSSASASSSTSSAASSAPSAATASTTAAAAAPRADSAGWRTVGSGYPELPKSSSSQAPPPGFFSLVRGAKKGKQAPAGPRSTFAGQEAVPLRRAEESLFPAESSSSAPSPAASSPAASSPTASPVDVAAPSRGRSPPPGFPAQAPAAVSSDAAATKDNKGSHTSSSVPPKQVASDNSANKQVSSSVSSSSSSSAPRGKARKQATKVVTTTDFFSD